MKVYNEQLVKNHPVAFFYILAFLISWAGWAPLIASESGIIPQSRYLKLFLVLPGVGPFVAAMIILELSGNGNEIKNLFQRLLRVNANAAYYFFAIFIPVLLLALTYGLDLLLPQVYSPSLPKGSAVAIFLALGISLISNPWEEVGWRGFALPKLQTRYGIAKASFVIGIFSGLWHLPIFFLPSEVMAGYPFHLWFISIVAVSFIYTWLYNYSGSLLITALFHVSLNVSSVAIGINSFATYSIVNIFFVLILIFSGKLRRAKKSAAGTV